MPVALVPRPWDFELPPGTQNLIPLHDSGPLEQGPPHEETGDGSRQPSGELPPVSIQDNPIPIPPSPEPVNSAPDNESIPLPSMTIAPPTLRDPPSAEVQL